MALSTLFAPAGRADLNQLEEQQQAVIQTSFITQVIESVPDMMLILNEHRQIISVNKYVFKALGVTDPSLLIGLRYGEAIGCIHIGEGSDGCGTSEACSACGAVVTILASQESGKQAEGECRLVIKHEGVTALDFEVQATPIQVAGNSFTIFALKDISSEKRRKILERTFFHDILNTIGGISGIANLLVDSDGQNAEDDSENKLLMVDLSENLVEEISQQRRLLSAEQGEYIPQLKSVNLEDILKSVCKLYDNHIQTPNRKVILENVPELYLSTDEPMLRRVVGNMTLNALEASSNNGTVKVSVMTTTDTVEIDVTNVGEIPKEVQLQIFKRSFSTKSSSDRGIGTYSMKLFGERYLGGKVGFRSSDNQTTFFIILPLACEKDKSESK